MQQLRRRMADVALFPPEDPARQAVVREISRRGGELEQEWLELLQENERLRLDLARVSLPSGLEERLMAIPDQYPPRMGTPDAIHRAWGPLWWWPVSRPWLRIAAALLIAAVGLVAIVSQWEPRQTRAVQSFAALAMASHEAHPQLAIASSEWSEIERSIEKEFQFEMQRPQMPADVRLLGASTTTTLAGCEVLYTRWEEADGTLCSVFQFCASDFGLRRPLPRQVIIPGVGDRAGRSFEVIVWSEGHCDYAMVRATRPPADRSPDQRPLQMAAAGL